MKNIVLLIILACLVSCKSKHEDSKTENQELTSTQHNSNSGNYIMIDEFIDLSKHELIPLNGKKIEKEKLILLDFWATWCGPCIASFPHLESLQREYESDMQVIALSKESQNKISTFLEKKNFELPFFIDKNESLNSLFAIESIPLSVLISSKGKFLWAGSSDGVNVVIDEYLNENKIRDRSLKPSNSASKYYLTTMKKTLIKKSIYTYTITSGTDDRSLYAVKTQKNINDPIDIEYVSAPVTDVIMDFMGVNYQRLRNNRQDLDTTLVDIVSKSTTPNINYGKESKKILNDLQSIYDFKISDYEKSMEVYSLKVIDENKLSTFIESTGGGGMVEKIDGYANITRLSLENLASYFEKKLNVVTDYDGKNSKLYNMVFNYPETIEELNVELEEKYGIVFKKVKSKIRFVEIN